MNQEHHISCQEIARGWLGMGGADGTWVKSEDRRGNKLGHNRKFYPKGHIHQP